MAYEVMRRASEGKWIYCIIEPTKGNKVRVVMEKTFDDKDMGEAWSNRILETQSLTQ